MKSALGILGLVAVTALLSGCFTVGKFKVPKDSSLYLQGSPTPVVISGEGVVTNRPFFWNASKGVPYKLEKNNRVIKEGTLPVRFRVVSIFWPPYAFVYWPLGFDPHQTYDLTGK